MVEHLTFNQVVRGSNPRCFTSQNAGNPLFMRVSGIFIFSYNSQITLINHKHMSHLYLNKMSQICLKSDMSQIIGKIHALILKFS